MSEAFELVAAASRSGSAHGIPVFSDIDELLRCGIPVDAVAMCQPPQERFTAAAKAIRAGKHVLLEKPPGATLGEVEELAKLAQSGGTALSPRGTPAMPPESLRRVNGWPGDASSELTSFGRKTSAAGIPANSGSGMRVVWEVRPRHQCIVHRDGNSAESNSRARRKCWCLPIAPPPLPPIYIWKATAALRYGPCSIGVKKARRFGKSGSRPGTDVNARRGWRQVVDRRQNARP